MGAGPSGRLCRIHSGPTGRLCRIHSIAYANVHGCFLIAIVAVTVGIFPMLLRSVLCHLAAHSRTMLRAPSHNIARTHCTLDSRPPASLRTKGRHPPSTSGLSPSTNRKRDSLHHSTSSSPWSGVAPHIASPVALRLAPSLCAVIRQHPAPA